MSALVSTARPEKATFSERPASRKCMIPQLLRAHVFESIEDELQCMRPSFETDIWTGRRQHGCAILNFKSNRNT